jgi:hypothetical protein
MAANRRSQSSSGEGFVLLVGLALLVGVVSLIVKFIWVILGLLALAASIYLARVMLRENRNRDEAYAQHCAAVATRADQQEEWLLQGDERGVFGPEAAELRRLLESGEKPGTRRPATAAVLAQPPTPLSLARRFSPAAIVGGGVAALALLSSVGNSGTSPPPTRPTIEPTRTPISIAVPTSSPSSLPTSTPASSATTSPVPSSPTSLPPTTYLSPAPAEPTLTYAPLPPELTSTYVPTPAPVQLVPPMNSGPYSSCGDAAIDGRYNIPTGDPGYSPRLDRDHDGIACES